MSDKNIFGLTESFELDEVQSGLLALEARVDDLDITADTLTLDNIGDTNIIFENNNTPYWTIYNDDSDNNNLRFLNNLSGYVMTLDREANNLILDNTMYIGTTTTLQNTEIDLKCNENYETKINFNKPFSSVVNTIQGYGSQNDLNISHF